jgi:hypothetical protein
MSFINAASGTTYYAQRSRTYSDMVNLLPQPWNNPYSVTGAPKDSTSQLYAPDYVDCFPIRKAYRSPILYLRAHIGTPAPTATDPAITASDDASKGPYYEYDNGELTAYGNAYPELMGKTPPINPTTGIQDFATWDAYFQDPSVITDSPPHQYVSTPTPTPSRRWNTYILISPGPDGIFGTADDIVGPS